MKVLEKLQGNTQIKVLFHWNIAAMDFYFQPTQGGKKHLADLCSTIIKHSDH